MSEKESFLKGGMIRVSEKVYISIFSVISAFLFVLSQGLVSSLIFASAVVIHELSHLFFLYRFNAKTERITLYPFGIDIRADTSRISYKKELIVTLAGGIANILSALFAIIILHKTPSQSLLFFIICNLFIGILNLIPLPCFDGGKAVRLILYDNLEIDKAFYTARFCDMLSSAIVILSCLFLIRFSNFNISVIMISVYACVSLFYLCAAKRSGHMSAP